MNDAEEIEELEDRIDSLESHKMCAARQLDQFDEEIGALWRSSDEAMCGVAECEQKTTDLIDESHFVLLKQIGELKKRFSALEENFARIQKDQDL